MEQKKKNTHKFRDPKAKLRAAIASLEQFTKLNASEPIPHIYHHPNKCSGLKKVIALASCFISSTFSEKVRKENASKCDKIEGEVRNAIDDVKRYHPLLSRKKSTEARALAARAIKAINHFNKMVESVEEKSTSWHKRLQRYLIKRSRLSLVNGHKVTLPPVQLSEKTPEENSSIPEKVASIIEHNPLSHPISDREVDAFRMKAISLIQNQKNLFPSIADALNSVRESPIFTTISSDATPGSVPASSVICLQQTISPFPGETIILRGAFKRNPSALSPSTPIPESFELSMQSVQTGFPDPSLYTGWTLADALIPPLPHRPEQLNILPQILKKRVEITTALIEKGPSLSRAKELLKLKREAAHENKGIFLSLHKKLCLAIISAAPGHLVSEDLGNFVLNFFTWLEKQAHPFDQLTQIYCELNYSFITKPFQTLQRTWIEQTDRNLFSDNPARSYSSALEILQKTWEEAKISLVKQKDYPKEVENFLIPMGRIFGVTSHNIILQYTSEMMEFSPPELSEFERKLQIAAFKQQQTFLEELEGDNPKNPFGQMEESLQENIVLFNSKGNPHPIVTELERYYKGRFLHK